MKGVNKCNQMYHDDDVMSDLTIRGDEFDFHLAYYTFSIVGIIRI